MSRCEHNERITKFCVTPSCNHRYSGGCEYCFKKYHCHIGQAKFIKEPEVVEIIKYLTSCDEKKVKVRSLKEAIYNYFNMAKSQLSTYLDCLSSELLNKISYPYIAKEGNLNVFKKLKHKEYSRLTTGEMIKILDFKQKNQPEKLQKNQTAQYFKQCDKVYEKIYAINEIYKEFQKEAQTSYTMEAVMSVSLFYKKIQDIHTYIVKEKENLQKQLSEKDKHHENEPHTLTFQRKNHQTLVCNKKSKREDQNIGKKQNIQNGEVEQKISETNSVASDNVSRNLRPRKLSIDSRCTDLIKSRLRSYEEKQKQITEGKKKLEQMLSLSQKKEQKLEQNGQQEDQMTKSVVSEAQSLRKSKNAPDIYAHTSLPPAIEEKNLYQQHESVGKKTLKIPVNVIQQHAEDQQCQSPIMRLKKSQKTKKQNASTGFQIGLFKVQPTTHQPHSDTVQVTTETQSEESPLASDKENQVPHVTIKQKEPDMALTDQEANSLFLLIESLKLSARKAIPLLEASLKYSPHNFSAAEYLSYLYLDENKPKKCLDTCNAALKLIAGEANSMEISFHLHNNKASALNMLGRFSEAIPILQSCLQFKKKDVLYKNLGDAYFSLGIIEKAVPNYEQAVLLNDENHQAFYNLAVCLFTQKNYESSKLKVQRALMMDQNNQSYIQLYNQLNKIIKAE